MLRERCPNDNHGRAVVTVRYCPNCGLVVNESIPARECPLEKHARLRRLRNTYCVDCGQGLVQERSGR
jgi:rRNA maturation protein Nop10